MKSIRPLRMLTFVEFIAGTSVSAPVRKLGRWALRAVVKSRIEQRGVQRSAWHHPRAQDMWPEAVAYLEELLELRRERLGPEHSDTLVTLVTRAAAEACSRVVEVVGRAW